MGAKPRTYTVLVREDLRETNHWKTEAWKGVKCKAIPIQDSTCPEGSRTLRLPEFYDKWHMKVARFSVLRTVRLYPQEVRG
jgi:hypothetical protein